MKYDFRDIAIMIIIGIITILAFFMLVDIFIEKDSVIGVGNVVSFFGSIIGGSLTLLGVKWTLDSQNRKEKQEKYEKAKYILRKLGPILSTVDSLIKSINQLNAGNKFDAVKNKVDEFHNIFIKHYDILLETEFNFINNIEIIQEQMLEMKSYIEGYPGLSDLEKKKGLMQYNEVIQNYKENIIIYMKKNR